MIKSHFFPPPNSPERGEAVVMVEYCSCRLKLKDDNNEADEEDLGLKFSWFWNLRVDSDDLE